MQSKRLTIEEAQKRILRFCAYQERSHHEVRNKLFAFGLIRQDVDNILTFLIEEGFLNEERFARAFAGGKFRMKKWGRLKITRELERHDLTANCIRLGLREIEDHAYEHTLREIIQRKLENLEEVNLYMKRDKLAKYAIRKGFEPELVWTEVKRQLPD